MSAVLSRINPESYGEPEDWEVTRLHHAAEYGRKCAHCGQQMQRNDLAIITREKVKGKTRSKVFHRPCWYTAEGKTDWYHPGAMADDPPELRAPPPAPPAEETLQYLPPEDPATGTEIEWVAPPPRPRVVRELVRRFGDRPPRNTPIVSEATAARLRGLADQAWTAPRTWASGIGKGPLVRKLKESAGPDVARWKRFLDQVRERRMKPNPPIRRVESGGGDVINIHMDDGNGGPAGGGGGSYVVVPHRRGSGSMLGWLLIVGAAGAAAAGWWFFIRHKYEPGQMLQHLTAEGTMSYQITELRYEGISHLYVMTEQVTSEIKEFKVSDVDGKTEEWIAT